MAVVLFFKPSVGIHVVILPGAIADIMQLDHHYAKSVYELD